MKLLFCIMYGWVSVVTWAQSSAASPLDSRTINNLLTPAPELIATVEMTLSKQPSKVFEAALGSKLQGVSGYAVRFCNPSFSPAIISGGMAAQAIEKEGLAVIAIELATIAARSARTHSNLYTVAKWTTNAAYYASLATNGFVPTSSIAARVIPLVIAHEASLAK